MRTIANLCVVIVLVAIFQGGSRTIFAQTHRHPAKAEAEATLSYKIPDAIVYDQNGKQLKFYSDLVKGKTVAINFIFTTCTTICPPLTATFRRIQQGLTERGETRVNLISISVDPMIDTPERLKAYAEKFKAEPGWTFVTGDKREIDKVLTALGAAVANKNDHTPSVVIGKEEAANWTRAYGLSRPATLVDLIIETAKRPPTTR